MIAASKKPSVFGTKKFLNFLTTLNELVENYQQEYHTTFGNVVFTPLIGKFKEKLDKNFRKKIENFESYEDQIKELNMMLDGNENNEANNTINLMIENLLIEKNKNDYDLQMEHENDIQDFLTAESQIDNLTQNEHFSTINGELKEKVLKLVLNQEIKS